MRNRKFIFYGLMKHCKGWNIHSLHLLLSVVPDKGRNSMHQYSCGVGFLCNVLADLIVLTGGLWTTWGVILALEVTVGGRWVKTCGHEAVCPHTQEQCSDATFWVCHLCVCSSPTVCAPQSWWGSTQLTEAFVTWFYDYLHGKIAKWKLCDSLAICVPEVPNSFPSSTHSHAF